MTIKSSSAISHCVVFLAWHPSTSLVIYGKRKLKYNEIIGICEKYGEIWVRDFSEEVHTRNVTWALWRPKSQTTRLLDQQFVSEEINRISKLCMIVRKTTIDRWIPLTKVQLRRNVFQYGEVFLTERICRSRDWVIITYAVSIMLKVSLNTGLLIKLASRTTMKSNWLSVAL